jgi:hypothetical protein
LPGSVWMVEKAPSAVCRRGLVFRLSGCGSFCRDFGDGGGAGGGLVHDGLVRAEGRDEGLDG